MAVNLLQKYSQSQETDTQPVNLLAQQGPQEPQDPQGAPPSSSFLEQIGNLAGEFNKSVEGTGLPSLARGFFSGMSAPVRLAGHFIPGEAGEQLSAELPQVPQGYEPRIPFTDTIIPTQSIGDIAGEIAGGTTVGIPMFKGLMEASKAARLPSMVSKPLAGGITGASLSPESPELGAVLGGAAPAAMTAAKAVRTAGKGYKDLGRTLLKKQEPEQAFNSMLERHDTLADTAKDLYEQSNKIAKQKNINGMKVPDNIIETVENFLPITKKSKDNLLNKVKNGEYEAITDLYSDLGKKSTAIRGNKNSTQADLNIAEELMDARKDLGKHMQEELTSKGHPEVAHLRNQADNIYREKMQTYYNKNLSPTIRSIFNESIRKRPGQTEEDLLAPFMERSDLMSEFLSKHPELKQEISLARDKQLVMEELKPLIRAGKMTALGGGALKTTEIIAKLLGF